MKKFWLVVLAIIMGIVALSNLGAMIGMAICGVIVYFSLKQFLATDSTAGKIIWAIIGFIGLSGLFHSLPALFGIAAVYVLYTIYRNWDKGPKKSPQPPAEEKVDPFEGFERQWEELKNNR